MNKRILFVDDEPMILQGIQHSLRGMRAEWEVQLAGSGAEALETMAQALIDNMNQGNPKAYEAFSARVKGMGA